MSKRMRWVLCIAAMVLVIVSLASFGFAQGTVQTQEPECYEHGDVNTDGVVDTRDAIHVLYHIMVGNIPSYAEKFAINQDWDYRSDGVNDTADAIYLLYHIMLDGTPLGNNYKLQGKIHDYYDPSWVWDEAAGTAQVTFKCGCGTPVSYTTGAGVTVTEGALEKATCVAAGSQTYTASVTVDGQEYTNTFVKTLPAGTGHDMVGTQGCETSSVCSLCGYTLAALGHSWELTATTEATCTEDAYQTYTCAVCSDTDKVVLEGTAAHRMGYDRDVQEGCKFTKWYKCANCDYTAPGKTPEGADEVYYKHNYTAALTQDATCVAKGLKTYTCANDNCTDSYTEDVDINESHDWVEVEKGDKVTTHRCSREGCEATKTTVAPTEETALDAATLKENELQLANNASMKLDDETVEALDREILVSVETVTPSEAGLSQEQVEKIGNSSVYDFNMTYSDGTAISDNGTEFAGEVTISLPYTLDDDEDVDSINVWYIDDEGNLTAVAATYSNGFVTFTTKHFSYYTVTRLTPAERCAAYGHVLINKFKAATCTEDGYDMQLCQRCGHVAKDETLVHAGHSYKKTVLSEATCDKAGAFEEICGTCGSKTTGTIPAIGHNMSKDEAKTVEADCKQVGKDVYVCANGCGHIEEDVKPQLNHQYEAHEEKAATCSAKGYTTNKCTLCGEIVTVEETAPLGHEYKAESAVWEWSEDRLSAKVTIQCANDKAHTKTLTAVVTEDIKAVTCENPGTVTYTAVATFNSATFTDSIVQTEAAAGHKPGTAWSANATQHYHICSVCEAKVDAVAHSWDAGKVEKAPTCGEAGTALYQCLICGYEAQRAVPATKEHNYVDGVCSGCGREEIPCFHQKIVSKELDLSAYGLCEGSYVVEYSCEACGEFVDYEYDFYCDFNYDDVEGEDVIINGREGTRWVYTCADCGLTMEELYYDRDVPGVCAVTRVESYTYSKAGQTIVSREWEFDARYHAGKTLVETVDLSVYGLCGEKIEVYTCGCERDVKSPRYIGFCDWDYIGEDETDDSEVYECASCGAVEKDYYTYDFDETTCEEIYEYTYTYHVDGKEVYRVTGQTIHKYHEYEMVSYELQGDSCEDGVLVEYVCAYCKETSEDYIDYHGRSLCTRVELSEGAMCADELRIYTCPCGKAQDYEFGPESCQWSLAEEEGGYSGEEYTEVYYCDDCGAKHTVSNIKWEKDANCKVWESSTHTFADSKGNHIATCQYSDWYETDHPYALQSVTLEGESCEDGVRYTVVCLDCGDTNSGSTEYHKKFVVADYDLSGYGMCSDGVRITECACGQESDFEFYGYDSYCEWDNVAGAGDEDEYSETYRCTGCEVEYVVTGERTATDDPCVNQWDYTVTFFKGQTELLSFDYAEQNVSHDMVASFTLNDSALGCAGGYTVTETCQRCGQTDSWTNPGSTYHNRYLVASKQVTNGQLCCEIVLETYSCACGKESSAQIRYEGDTYCSWEYAGNEVYVCENCKVARTEAYRREKVEGITCQIRSIWHYSYTKDGQALLSYDTYNTEYSHRYVYTFQMNGDTCEDGYTVQGICLDCGTTSTYTGRYCTSRPVERVVTVDDENACSIVELVNDRCACGKLNNWYVENDCNWTHTGYDDDGNEIYICDDCGMKWTQIRQQTRIPKSCQYQVTISDTLELNGKTYSVKKEYVTTEHRWIYEMTLADPAAGCEGGYTVVKKCVYCDETETTWSEPQYGHETRRTAYYSLEDYGMCGGYVSVRSCACGQESDWSWDLNDCEGRSTGKTDPDTGYTEYYCADCQKYFSWGSTGEYNKENCRYEGTFAFKLRSAEETLVYVTGKRSYESHDTRVIRAELQTPGGSCEDGVRLFWQCRFCDHSDSYFTHWHEAYARDGIEAGCGGGVYYYECACAENKYVSIDTECEDYLTKEWTKTEEDGLSHHYYEKECPDCGLYILRDTVEVDLEDCQVESRYIYTVRMGEQEQTFQESGVYTEHNYGEESRVLAPGSETCEDGVLVSRTCKDCGYENSWTSTDCSTFLQETVSLADKGACDGELRIYRCACGQKSSVDYSSSGCYFTSESWTETDENGIEYSHTLYSCRNCDLKREYVYYREATATLCEYIRHEVETVTCGEYELTAHYYYTTTDHDYQYTYTLVNGAESCEDGVRETVTCTVCDYTYSSLGRDHYTALVESIDLAAYGSVCGGALEHYSCACGARQSYRLSDELQCDLDRASISNWVSGTLNTSQPITEHGDTYSYSYLYRCAVTDPQACPLTIRMSEYWLKGEGCSAVQYQTWQLGYDGQTDTCLKEITVATGYQHSYHDYEETNLYAKADDGSYVSGTRYDCADCQSYAIDQYDYDADGHLIRQEDTRVNTLDNGERKLNSHITTYEAVVEGNSSCYEVTNLNKDIYADGEEYWSRYDYSYDAPNCSRTCTYTNSDGDTYISQETVHLKQTYHYDSKSATCSQPGYYHAWDTCDACGKITWEQWNDYEPGHNWQWNGVTYECYTCGLENANGADGSIIMEDLTAAKGGDTEYVIGYYNPKKIQVVANVSVILDNAQGDNQIDLGITDFTYKTAEEDGYTGLSFNKAAADEAAAAAVAAIEGGYEGSYAIRISLVPVNSTDTLDYAITFDSVMAQ